MEKKKVAKDYRAGHRKRLRGKFHEDKCTDKELMELWLTYVLPRGDIKPAVYGLFKKYGNVYKIVTAPAEELLTIPGIGKKSVELLKTLHKVMLVNYKYCLSENPIFIGQKDLENYCRLKLFGKNVEEFHVLYLDVNRRLIEDHTHATGTKDSVAAYPREILIKALGLNAKFVILVHNHPDGHASFSEDDIVLSEKVGAVLKVDHIELIDHLLLAGETIWSAKKLHWLK